MGTTILELRLRRVGNSFGVILSKEALKALGIEGREGVKLTLASLPGGGLELRHVDEEFERKLSLLRDTIKRYRSTLRELAK